MARAKTYVNHKGKRRVLLELTGKEAASLYLLANWAGGDTDGWGCFPDRVVQAMRPLMEVSGVNAFSSYASAEGELPEVIWKDAA